jgi:hypothetical protein
MKFVVLRAVIMKISVFLNVRPSSLVDRHNVSEESAASIFETEEGSKRGVNE